MRKATLESKFYVRGEPITSYYSFRTPDNIENTMNRQFEFLDQFDKFEMKFKLVKD